MRLIIPFFCSFLLLCTTQFGFGQAISRNFVSKQITGAENKFWRKCGTLPLTERMEGDTCYSFSAKDKKFSVLKCNGLLNWITVSSYNWQLVPEDETTGAGWHHMVLLINGKNTHFVLSANSQQLILLLPKMEYRICLQ